MPYVLKIRLKYFKKDENIALNCNYKQIYNKKSTRDAIYSNNTAYVP